jgi:hypothetical protein
MKKWYTSKTIQSAIAQVIASIGLAAETGDWWPLVFAVWGAVNVVIRYNTSTGLSK